MIWLKTTTRVFAALGKVLIVSPLLFTACSDSGGKEEPGSLEDTLSQRVFNDVGTNAGILPYSMAIGPHAGVAAEDYDKNGMIDLFVPNGLGIADQLYRNVGNGKFEEIAEQVGLDLLQNHRTALWVDYDGDQDLDLLIGGDCRDDPPTANPCADPENLWLYRQKADGQFEDVTIAAGLDVTWGGSANWHRGGLAAGDINNDGYLELLVTGWDNRAHLFLNNTDGTFTDITSTANIPVEVSRYQQSIFHDFNRDGLIDIYFAIDFGVPNRLFINQGDDSFVDLASSAGVDYGATDMGLALGDIDNDGDIDIYVTVITQATRGTFEHNKLYRNDSTSETLLYTDIAQSVDVYDAFWGWGVTFIDYDNDGWQDLAVTNGKNRPAWEFDQSIFWQNPGQAGGKFANISDQVQFNDTYIGAGLISVDYDRDGDLDLIQTTSEDGPLRLLRNDWADDELQPENHYLIIKPRMNGPNHWAIGAVVTAHIGTLKMTRAITAGTSIDSQEPAEAFFGLGSATTVDQVVIDWPNGQQSTFSNINADQVIELSLP